MRSDKKSSLTLNNIARIHLILLKISGLVAFDGHDFTYFPTILISIYVHCCHMLISCMYLWNLLVYSLAKTYNVEVVGGCLGLCGVHMRFLILYARRLDIASILKTAQDFWTEIDDDEKWTIRYFVRRSARVTYFYLTINCMMCAFFFAVSQFAVPLPEGNQTAIRMLPYPFFVDIQETPWYQIALSAEMIGVTVSSVTVSGFDTAAPFFIMIASGHFKILCNRVENLAKQESCEFHTEGMKILIECIVYHQKIIKFCKAIENLTRQLFMVQLLSTTYNMSLLGLKLLEDDPGKMKYITVILLLGTQLFMCQWAADVLASESEAIARSAYFFPAKTEEQMKKAKLIHILIMRSQRSIQLTAGGIVNLSIECFGSMVTSAMSFFTVLRSM